MKLCRLWIDRFKNLRNCEVTFEQPYLLNAVIGGNGSGKSNLVEAILHILLDTYLNKTPPFDFCLEYVAQGRHVELSAAQGRLRAVVDGQEMPIRHFTRRLRDGEAQVYYPETTFAYYSGDCDRVRRLLKRYSASFRRLVQQPERDNLRPLFVLSTNQQARHIRAKGTGLPLHTWNKAVSRSFPLCFRVPDGWADERGARPVVASAEKAGPENQMLPHLQPAVRRSSATSRRALGLGRAIASRVRAAPLGCFRPCSQP